VASSSSTRPIFAQVNLPPAPWSDDEGKLSEEKQWTGEIEFRNAFSTKGWIGSQENAFTCNFSFKVIECKDIKIPLSWAHKCITGSGKGKVLYNGETNSFSVPCRAHAEAPVTFSVGGYLTLLDIPAEDIAGTHLDIRVIMTPIDFHHQLTKKA
jgi:hypothetical protein